MALRHISEIECEPIVDPRSGEVNILAMLALRRHIREKMSKNCDLRALKDEGGTNTP